jgi:hypothetical protein
MRFLCLGYHDESVMAAMSLAERDEFLEECVSFDNELRKTGRVIDGQSLHSAATARTIRFRGSSRSTTDGPFAETKEQLGGFLVLEADDLDHAVELMSQVPCGRLGGALEIRQIHESFLESGCGQPASAAAAAR